ncbi:hypothetical protein M0R45_015701 [Rubus argutus]|uniref:Uncharacterized protein n=1 Tax=Rubus argutus TaxID=59490 RepID=A0AAW1XRK0_RUBAR
MASWVLPTLLFALAFAHIELSNGQVLKAKVTCLDCDKNYDFSGIKVLVKCDQVKKLAMATTEADGSFEVKLPSDHSKSPAALHCLAKILGGTNQLYASRKDKVSEIVKTPHHSKYSHTISTPLGFSTSCPLSIADQAACKAKNEFSSSKTIDLPLPREWGLAPSSYYIPFFPIIGIP